MDDKLLIKEILSQNGKAFESLVGKYKNLVYNTTYRLVGNRADAEDIFQDVFLEVYRSLQYIQNDDDISSWLFKIAYHKSVSFLRKKKPSKSISGNAAGDTLKDSGPTHKSIDPETPANILEKKEASVILFQAIDNLPELQKKILLLHKFEGYSQKEICSRLNLSDASVESHIYRAKVTLRKVLLHYFKKN